MHGVEGTMLSGLLSYDMLCQLMRSGAAATADVGP